MASCAGTTPTSPMAFSRASTAWSRLPRPRLEATDRPATSRRSSTSSPASSNSAYPPETARSRFLPTHLIPVLPAGLLVQHVLPSPNHLVIVANLDRASAACPGCEASSSHVHSRYERTLGDLPCQGQPVTLRVEVRRFRCPTPLCPRRTFAERLAGMASLWHAGPAGWASSSGMSASRWADKPV